VYLSAASRAKQASCRTCDAGGVIEDGAYDALVVDARSAGDAIALDLTILTGPHKGEVVSIRADRTAVEDVDEIDVLGLPGRLVVENGVPAFTVER
jgi:hypothetical protein